MRYLYCIHSHDFPLLLSVSFGWISGFTVTSGSVVLPPSAFTASCCWKGVQRRELKPPRVPLQRRGPAQVAWGILTFLVGGCNLMWKIWVKIWNLPPNFGVKIQKIEKKNTQILCFTPFSGNRSPLPNVHLRFHRWNNGPGRPIVPLALELVPSYKAPKNFDVQNKSFTLTGCVAFLFGFAVMFYSLLIVGWLFFHKYGM